MRVKIPECRICGSKFKETTSIFALTNHWKKHHQNGSTTPKNFKEYTEFWKYVLKRIKEKKNKCDLPSIFRDAAPNNDLHRKMLLCLRNSKNMVSFNDMISNWKSVTETCDVNMVESSKSYELSKKNVIDGVDGKNREETCDENLQETSKSAKLPKKIIIDGVNANGENREIPTVKTNHLNQSTVSQGILQCKKCDKIFSSFLQALRHRKEHNAENDGKKDELDQNDDNKSPTNIQPVDKNLPEFDSNVANDKPTKSGAKEISLKEKVQKKENSTQRSEIVTDIEPICILSKQSLKSPIAAATLIPCASKDSENQADASIDDKISTPPEAKDEPSVIVSKESKSPENKVINYIVISDSDEDSGGESLPDPKPLAYDISDFIKAAEKPEPTLLKQPILKKIVLQTVSEKIKPIIDDENIPEFEISGVSSLAKNNIISDSANESNTAINDYFPVLSSTDVENNNQSKKSPWDDLILPPKRKNNFGDITDERSFGVSCTDSSDISSDENNEGGIKRRSSIISSSPIVQKRKRTKKSKSRKVTQALLMTPEKTGGSSSTEQSDINLQSHTHGMEESTGQSGINCQSDTNSSSEQSESWPFARQNSLIDPPSKLRNSVDEFTSSTDSAVPRFHKRKKRKMSDDTQSTDKNTELATRTTSGERMTGLNEQNTRKGMNGIEKASQANYSGKSTAVCMRRDSREHTQQVMLVAEVIPTSPLNNKESHSKKNRDDENLSSQLESPGIATSKKKKKARKKSKSIDTGLSTAVCMRRDSREHTQKVILVAEVQVNTEDTSGFHKETAQITPNQATAETNAPVDLAIALPKKVYENISNQVMGDKMQQQNGTTIVSSQVIPTSPLNNKESHSKKNREDENLSSQLESPGIATSKKKKKARKKSKSINTGLSLKPIKQKTQKKLPTALTLSDQISVSPITLPTHAQRNEIHVNADSFSTDRERVAPTEKTSDNSSYTYRNTNSDFTPQSKPPSLTAKYSNIATKNTEHPPTTEMNVQCGMMHKNNYPTSSSGGCNLAAQDLSRIANANTLVQNNPGASPQNAPPLTQQNKNLNIATQDTSQPTFKVVNVLDKTVVTGANSAPITSLGGTRNIISHSRDIHADVNPNSPIMTTENAAVRNITEPQAESESMPVITNLYSIRPSLEAFKTSSQNATSDKDEDSESHHRNDFAYPWIVFEDISDDDDMVADIFIMDEEESIFEDISDAETCHEVNGASATEMTAHTEVLNMSGGSLINALAYGCSEAVDCLQTHGTPGELFIDMQDIGGAEAETRSQPLDTSGELFIDTQVIGGSETETASCSQPHDSSGEVIIDTQVIGCTETKILTCAQPLDISGDLFIDYQGNDKADIEVVSNGQDTEDSSSEELFIDTQAETGTDNRNTVNSIFEDLFMDTQVKSGTNSEQDPVRSKQTTENSLDTDPSKGTHYGENGSEKGMEPRRRATPPKITSPPKPISTRSKFKKISTTPQRQTTNSASNSNDRNFFQSISSNDALECSDDIVDIQPTRRTASKTQRYIHKNISRSESDSSVDKSPTKNIFSVGKNPINSEEETLEDSPLELPFEVPVVGNSSYSPPTVLQQTTPKQPSLQCETTTETRMNIRQLARKGVLTDVQDCIKFLREYQLLAREMNCPKCAIPMQEEKTKACKQDGYRWRCNTTRCRTTATIRKGSFFGKSNLGLTELVLLIYFWAADVPQRQIADESEVSERTIVDWAKYLREICSTDLIGKEREIGGPGHTVSIDETQVARGRWGTNEQGRPVKAQWLFGGIDITTKKVFIELVPEPGRTAPIMEELITKHIARGTIIWSDKFASYNNIEGLGRDYTHKTVNHGREYITDDVVHINDIESLWADIKRKFERMNGVARHFIPSYLDEWLWRRQYPRTRQFLEILKAIANDPHYAMTGRLNQ